MRKKPIIVLGGGGHSLVLIDTLKLIDATIIGITDFKKDLINSDDEVTIIGDDSEVYSFNPNDILLVNGLGSSGSTEKRKQIFQKFKKDGYTFANIIHPSAIISKNVDLGEGIQIMAGAVIQVGAKLGDNTIINTKVSIDHECVIGRHVHIAPGATLSGNVKVEDEVHIGTGTIVIQGINVGYKSFVGAGSVVIKDVRETSKVLGVPAREREL